MTFCLTKSSEKSKNSLIRGGFLLTLFFKISKFSLIRGGGLFMGGLLLVDPVYLFLLNKKIEIADVKTNNEALTNPPSL